MRGKREDIQQLVDHGVFFHLIDKVLNKTEFPSIVTPGIKIVEEILSKFGSKDKESNDWTYVF